MKILSYVIIALLLGLSSCKKSDSAIGKKIDDETFVLNGERFNIKETTKKLSLILNVDENRLTFNKDSIAYTLAPYEGHLMYIEEIIESIKNVQL